MSLAIRLVTTFLLAALFLFCIFGFLATFEPLPRSTQIIWRLIYGSAGILLCATLTLVNRRKPK